MLIFQILMEGAHPFAGVYAGAGEPPPLEARITAGHFAYNLSRTGNYRPMPTALAFELLAPALQQLFTQAFIIGHKLPHLRPTAQQWADALHVAEQTLLTCAANAQHRYGNHLSACPWCERTRLLNGRDPFPSPAAAANALAQRHPKSAATYWHQLLAPELKARALMLANTVVPYAVVTQDMFLTLWDIARVCKVQSLAFTVNGQQLISAETGRKFWQQPSGAIREGGNVALKFWRMNQGSLEQVVNLASYWLE